MENSCQVFHTGLPIYLSHEIERIQRRAMHIIFPELSYEDAINEAYLPNFSERRHMFCSKLFDVMVSNSDNKLAYLLPQRASLSRPLIACVASVSSGQEANPFSSGRARIGLAQKKLEGGGEEKETLAVQPLHFENSRSPTNGVSDWCGLEFLIDISQLMS